MECSLLKSAMDILVSTAMVALVRYKKIFGIVAVVVVVVAAAVAATAAAAAAVVVMVAV